MRLGLGIGIGIGIGDVDRRIVSPRKFRSDISDQDFDFKTDHFGPEVAPGSGGQVNKN